MDRDRAFNFKLLLPPRVNNGHISAVRPQEIVENCDAFMNTLQQGFTKCFDKEQSMPFPNTSVVAPTKPTRQDFPVMKAVSPMEKEENHSNPGQLYSKLFTEVEKIKCWKVKADSDTVQKERRLQENRRTIETQRKAIQELQFGNESLSIKLEEQISENEDLRNKNNATRNLCNILKDTFQRSAEKMHLLETEREETHHLYMENSESIQKLMAAFESLRIRAEADQKELQKVKEDLLELEDLKERYYQENNVKKKEVAELQTKLGAKENELQKILLDFHETQKQRTRLQEKSDEQHELLKSSKTEQESLLQKLKAAEQKCKETESNLEAISATLEQSKAEYSEMIQSKDLSLQELSRVNDQQAEKLEESQTTIQEQLGSLASERQRAKELEDELQASKEEVERRSTLIGETSEQSAKKDEQIKILKEELDNKSKSIETMKGQIHSTEVRVEELTADFTRKTEEAQLLKNEAEAVSGKNDLLKVACEAAEKAQEDLKEKCNMAEIKVQELEGQLMTEMKKDEEHTLQINQLDNVITQQKLKYNELQSNFNELKSEKAVIQQLCDRGSSSVKALEANLKVSEGKIVKLTREIQRLEEEKESLREEVNSVTTQIQGGCQETETLQKEIEEKCEQLEDEISGKDKHIKAVETKLCNLRKKMETKVKAQEEYQKENKVLKKQIAKEIAKSHQLELVITSLQEESHNLDDKEHEKLLRDLESKSTCATELEIEVQKLRSMATEAQKNKEDTELKCQQKIADMVTLMEKHKSQYDRMVEEKDTELDEKKKKEMESVAHIKSLESDLSKQKTGNDQLTQQLKKEVLRKEELQKELSDLKKTVSPIKVPQLTEAENKQSPATKCNTQDRCSETPRESSSRRHLSDNSKKKKTPSSIKEDGGTALLRKAKSDSIRTPSGTTPKTKEIHNEEVKTPSITNSDGRTSKIKSYRIRTPPSGEKAAGWGKSSITLDPKSDSSDQNDLLSVASGPTPRFSAPQCKLNIFRKIQSPSIRKSPGNSLKLAAMKRMRDAGWTAVTGSDKKKKKKTQDKIFA